MHLLKISAVSYLNTFPFVYGVLKSGYLKDYRLDLDVPSLCAAKLKNGEVDIALVPAGAITDFSNPAIVSDYCIGAAGKVRTVLLLSRKPLESITQIHLDNDSRTSVRLVRTLSHHFWKISPDWININPGQSIDPEIFESVVAIGDKTFELVRHYPYVYDLAEEWMRFTGLPIVFALWLSKRPIPESIARQLNHALKWGIDRKTESLDFFRDKLPPCGDCLDYLEKNISYQFDEDKKRGLELFLKYIL